MALPDPTRDVGDREKAKFDGLLFFERGRDGDFACDVGEAWVPKIDGARFE